MNHRFLRTTASTVLAVGLLITGLSLTTRSAHAQTRFSYSSGQELSPSYEGWIPNDDGSFTYTSRPGYSGADTFSYVVKDADTSRTSLAVLVTITVTPAGP